MIQGIVRNGRVLIENEADASTLRNKGYTGQNLGQRLSLDLVTSFDLLVRKKIVVLRGSTPVTAERMQEMLSSDERKTAIAFHLLKVKGMRPLIRRRRLYSDGKSVAVYWDSEYVDFATFRSKNATIAVVDSEGSCLLYTVREVKRIGGITRSEHGISKLKGISLHLPMAGVRIGSGLKFGSEFRVYDGSSPHAKYLMTIEDKSIARNLVARVRISQSVRKTFLQAVPITKQEKYRLFEIKWIRR